MKKVVVLSLGGSIIIPKDINIKFLKKFKDVLKKHSKKYKFIVVCGGGSTAREYINGLEKEKSSKKKFYQGLLGIASTRLNARFMTYFFGNDANKGIPHDMKEVKNMLRIYDIVFCGALRYAKEETSDGTSAKLSKYFNTFESFLFSLIFSISYLYSELFSKNSFPFLKFSKAFSLKPNSKYELAKMKYLL